MKTSEASFAPRAFGFLLLVLAGGAFTATASEPGSVEAATETAVAAAAKALSVASAPATVQGDVATARVAVGGLGCTVQMQRDAKGPEGWLVTRLACQPRK